MNKMKIVFLLNSSFPYYSGGRETWLFNISKELSERGYSIYIFSYKNYGRDEIIFDISNKINVISVKTLKNVFIFKYFIRSYFRLIDSIYSSFRMMKKIQSIFSSDYKNCIFISLDTVFTGHVLRKLKMKWRDLPFICASKAPHAELLAAKFQFFGRYFHKIEKKSYESADEIWANGFDTQKSIKELGFDSVMIGNGVNIKAIDKENKSPEEDIYRSEKFKITSVATLLDIKGINELLKAGGFLVEKGFVDFNLIFIGKGTPSKYKAYAKKIRISEKVSFLGERKNIIPYLKKSDLIACLSGGGGMSMSALESLASKTPVIAWNSPIYTQIIEDGINGFLAEEKNPKDLAEKISYIIENHDKLTKVGGEARKRVEKYDWGKITDKIVIRIQGLALESKTVEKLIV